MIRPITALLPLLSVACTRLAGPPSAEPLSLRHLPDALDVVAAGFPACPRVAPATGSTMLVRLEQPPIELKLPAGFSPAPAEPSGGAAFSHAWADAERTTVMLNETLVTGAPGFGILGHRLDVVTNCTAPVLGRTAVVRLLTATPDAPGSDTLHVGTVEVAMIRGRTVAAVVISPSRTRRDQVLTGMLEMTPAPAQ